MHVIVACGPRNWLISYTHTLVPGTAAVRPPGASTKSFIPPTGAASPMADGGAAAASRGAAETDQLLENVQQQLDRLVIQLQDCEELRDELDDDEYAETREDTLRQMQVRALPSHMPHTALQRAM